MSRPSLRRTLWYSDGRERFVVDQDFLTDDARSLIVLGEAGMGKSTLLEALGDRPGYALCTARKLMNAPNPGIVLGQADTLVIDALDEVVAKHDGDAVDRVLQQLARLGSPRFILSCRAADWRSATALQGIGDFYQPLPLQLHLEPFDRADAMQVLTASLQEIVAEQTIDRLEDHGLGGLWENPQTLELVERVASAGRLPNSKGDLFTEATKLLRQEHREEKAGSVLSDMSESDVLDHAGAAFAALIMTGKEALSRLANPAVDDLALRELANLPQITRSFDILDSRLFAALGPERFSYAHRAIGEFLGARWLARTADTPRKQRRLLELFGNGPLVPASLRGLHSWLAFHGPELAERVIAADPMGVIEYGDADRLSPQQGKFLLNALSALSVENPRFREWKEYRVGGLAQIALLPQIRETLSDTGTEFGLKLLVLQALAKSPLLPRLRDVLIGLLCEASEAFAIRSLAGDRLIEIGDATDWPGLIALLRAEGSENGVRLASELMDDVGYSALSDGLVLDVVLAQLDRTERMIGVYSGLERNYPADRLDTLLDGISAAATEIGLRHERRSMALTDLAFALLLRRLPLGKLLPARVWAWLRPFNNQTGLQRETHKAVAELFVKEDGLRRAIQQLVLLDDPDKPSVWNMAWSMRERSPGLEPSETDIVLLLGALEPGDERWRELVRLGIHDADRGVMIRTAAARFVANPEDEEWLARLAVSMIPEWQIEQEQRLRDEQEKRERDWALHRADFTARIEAMRAGDYGTIINPAKAYLKLFYDMNDKIETGPERIEEWLGPILRDACLAGFERFLTADPPYPTACDIAESHAEGKRWEAAYIIIVALAERIRTGKDLADLPSERLTAGFLELQGTSIHDHAGLGDLDELLATELRARGAWEAALRLHFEPQLRRKSAHVDGLYKLVRDTDAVALATRLAIDWLSRYPNMADGPEAELVDLLLTTGEGQEALRALVQERRRKLGEMNDERRRNWDAIGLILDFEDTRARLDTAGPIEPDLLWHVRNRLGERRENGRGVNLGAVQLAWLIAAFRASFKAAGRPQGVTHGDTNAWDASDYLSSLISRLGDLVDDDAVRLLTGLRDAALDGYSHVLRIAAAEQKRKRVEALWVSPDFATIANAASDTLPTTSTQMQAVLLEELHLFQKKLRGSDIDLYTGFFMGGQPRGEEACRDELLKLIRPFPFGIQSAPEGHLADDKRCDIACTLGDLMVPIEVKGQWNATLWTAADAQLDHLYTNDWRADRGIYLVLWFGTVPGKSLTKPPAGVAKPETADELRMALSAQSRSARDDRTEVVVLDLTRPD